MELKFKYLWKHEGSMAIGIYTIMEISKGLAIPPRSKVKNVIKCWELLSIDQFTGKHDSECNEIYHLDIISDHVGIGLVAWCDENCCFKVSYRGENKGQGKWFRDYTDNELKSILVIGNQYQNGDLLK